MEIAIVLAYFLVLVVVGYLAYRKVKGSTDQFFVAGRSLGTFINSWAFLASLASGGSVMALAGTNLSLGFTFLSATTAGAPVGFVVASILVARPLRQLGQYTLPDYFEARYGSLVMRWTVPVVIVLASMAYIVAQMKGASIIAGAVLGWDYNLALWVSGVIFVLYVAIGGFLSVTWNDIFQGILMFAMMVGFGVAAYSAMGGFNEGLASATDNFPVLEESGLAQPVWSYVGGFVTWACAISVLPHVIMRVYSSKDVRSAKISLNTAMLIFVAMMLIGFLVITPAAGSLITGDELTDADAAFLLLSERVLSPLFQGVVAAAILAAIMSTTAGLLMACNSAIAHDIFQKILKPGSPEKQVVRVANLATWVVGLTCIALAMNPPEFLIVLYTGAVALLASAFFAPMVLGIWWRRASTPGAVAGMLSGAVVFSVAFVAFDLPPTSEVLYGLPLSFIVTIAVSLAMPGVPAPDQQGAVVNPR